jgi:hypothetical protein
VSLLTFVFVSFCVCGCVLCAVCLWLLIVIRPWVPSPC